MAFWIVTSADGSCRHQVRTRGREKPWRDVPEGWSFIEVPRHSHDPRERFDETTRRWKRCPELTAAHEARERATAEKFVAQLPEAVLDLIAERVSVRILAQTEKKES